MANAGTWPIDPATDTGLFRFEVGDVVGTAHIPADGAADFEFMSDDTIDALLVAYPSRLTAMAKALGSMANQLIAAAQDIVVDDIKIKTIERANMMLTRATNLDANALIGDASSAFSVVPSLAATNVSPYGALGRLNDHPRAYGPSGF